MYFPDLDPGMLPERSFIMGILSTLRGEEMKELIKNARENRSLVNKVDNDELIWMSTDVRNDIFEILPHKSMTFLRVLLNYSHTWKSKFLVEARSQTQEKESKLKKVQRKSWITKKRGKKWWGGKEYELNTCFYLINI